MALPKPYYDHGGITIYHGDCLEALPELDPVDLVLTDPPYGHGKKWQGGTWATNSMYSDAEKWDHAKVNNRLIIQATEAGKNAIVWGGNYYTLPPSRCWFAWDKVEKMDTLADFELAWTSFDRPAKSFVCHRQNGEDRKHPTQKPLKLIRWCVLQADKKETQNTILDPFMGSGTTLVAAKELGRKAIGIEIEEKYCEIAVKRLSQEVFDFSGKEQK